MVQPAEKAVHSRLAPFPASLMNGPQITSGEQQNTVGWAKGKHFRYFP